jgi:hypothetical protein
MYFIKVMWNSGKNFKGPIFSELLFYTSGITICIFVILGLELRVWHLLSRLPTTWTTPPALITTFNSFVDE